MRKKLLFVMPSLDAGGGEKSLVNLLGIIDAEKYQVDVMLFHKNGLFLKMLPAHVRVLEIEGDYRIFSRGLVSSIKSFLRSFKFAAACSRIVFAIKNKRIQNKAIAEQQSWKNAASTIPRLEGRYDAAIAFLEKSSIYYVVDKVNSDKKIGWIHTNYASSGMQAEFDAPYFSRLDHIVTVSDECGSALHDTFPKETSKIVVMHNIISGATIRRLAEICDANEIGSSQTTILSVGRLSAEKGFDLAIDACAILNALGVQVNWYLIGEGKERPMLEQKIKDHGLEGKFHMLGARENPYPYLKKAAVYAQTSRYEGKSIAIDEAKIMHKPIVVTNFTTVKDQISNGENGVVADMDPESIANGILKILNDYTVRDRLVSNLKKEHLSNESEIETLYRLIEN
jgi:glycosyltransferase involved in cell wall biosynthesis